MVNWCQLIVKYHETSSGLVKNQIDWEQKHALELLSHIGFCYGLLLKWKTSTIFNRNIKILSLKNLENLLFYLYFTLTGLLMSSSLWLTWIIWQKKHLYQMDEFMKKILIISLEVVRQHENKFYVSEIEILISKFTNWIRFFL